MGDECKLVISNRDSVPFTGQGSLCTGLLIMIDGRITKRAESKYKYELSDCFELKEVLQFTPDLDHLPNFRCSCHVEVFFAGCDTNSG